MFFIILFVTHFNQLSHTTKREAKDFSALKRGKNTAVERASGKNVVTVVDLVFVLCKIGIFRLVKPGIMKSTFLE